MADQLTEGLATATPAPSCVKRGLAEMLKGGVIMDVVDPEQAKIAEDAGAVAVMALERVPVRHPPRRWRGPHVATRR